MIGASREMVSRVMKDLQTAAISDARLQHRAARHHHAAGVALAVANKAACAASRTARGSGTERSSLGAKLDRGARS